MHIFLKKKVNQARSVQCIAQISCVYIGMMNADEKSMETGEPDLLKCLF